MPISQNLPASRIADKLNDILRISNTVVVTAPPGAGKSTLLPLTILHGLVDSKANGDFPTGKVLMLEPRRLAARQIAERMASMVGEKVGDTVGYRIRFENKVSERTQIEVLTEGVLTRRLVSDPTLDDVSVVIFDEFHERSLASDVALALTREVQQLLRLDLRIVIMSATIDTDAICSALSAPLVECGGRMFDVKEIRMPRERDTLDTKSISQDVCHAIREAHNRHEGDILVFLPGQGEIMLCHDMLNGTLGTTAIYPLYGLLSPEEQRKAIAPSPPGTRKVVLATSIAETSITIEGVRIVIDSGLCRHLVFDQRTGLSRLETTRISRDMARQRMGRAGRVAEGVCYQLWSLATEHNMHENRTPEIIDADLSPTLLDIIAWGAGSMEELPWITPPPHYNVQKAMQLLHLLGAIDSKNHLTEKGKTMVAIPCHPRISKMVSEASTATLKALAADIAAIIEERDPLASSENDTDMSTRIILLREARKKKQHGRWSCIIKIAEQYRCIAHVKEDNDIPDTYDIGMLIANAYPERIGMQTANGHYRLSGGENASIDSSDQMSAYDWIAIASMNAASGKVFLAAPVKPQSIKLTERDNISWNSKQGCLTAQREWRIGQLTVDSKPLHDIPHDTTIDVIAQAAQKDGLSMFSFDDKAQHLQRRIAAVATWHPEASLPDVSTEAIIGKASEWLPLYIGKATTTSELRKINICDVIWSRLTYEQQMKVEHLAPSHIQVPTGSRIRLDYRHGAEAPVLSVRLQECFGMTETPNVNDGKQPVLMELLSPGYKPVQLTQDLHSFWQTTYFDVRKDLRRRYPKHSWPDNPLDVEPVRGVKRR